MEDIHKILFWSKNYFSSLRLLFNSFRIWLRGHKKAIIIRKWYSISRFIFISFQILLRKNEKIIITGCGRSATGFVRHYFNEFGIRIGHEKLEKHGISSWTLVPDTYKSVWGPSYKTISYLEMPIIHQVRNPLDVISSVRKVFSDKKSWEFISKFIPLEKNDTQIVKSMKYWYYWNLLAEKKAIYTYRVENIENEMKNILAIGKFKISISKINTLKNISKKVNSRKHYNLDWDDLRNADKELTCKIVGLAKKYGYVI